MQLEKITISCNARSIHKTDILPWLLRSPVTERFHPIETPYIFLFLNIFSSLTYCLKAERRVNLIFAWKSQVNVEFTSSQLIHGRNLRERNLLRPAQARTNYGHRSLETFGPMLFNKVPPDIQKLHHQHAFKWSLKCQLRNEQFIRTCFTADFLKLNFLIK